MKRSGLILMFTLLLISCSKRLATSSLDESFDKFYDRFHQDWTFQKERIKFPLEGFYEGPEGVEKWSLEDWEYHKQKVTEITAPNFDTEMIKKEDVVIDRVQQRDAGFSIERRFKKIDGRWYLVYYESVNL